jgi:pSer/pThr/pTyr-binding forkhead associated (FHA) protein
MVEEKPNDSAAADESAMVMLHLLDPASGRALQVWLLASQPVIRIGRDPNQEVCIPDPYVSRLHAELRLQDGRWQIVSLGRNGVLVDGQRITQFEVYNGVNFRLGTEGPTLRFFDTPPAATGSATITSDTMGKFALRLDDTKVDQEVREIAEGDYFRRLQERARALRRPSDSGTESR